MRKKEILHEDSPLFCMINRTITVGMIDDYCESLNYYFIARKKETVVLPFAYIRWLRLSGLHAGTRYKHTHKHTLMHILFDLSLQGLA